jgi:hypothetical protein
VSSSVEKTLVICDGQLCGYWADLGHTGNGVIESLLGQVAGLVRLVADLVVEDGEVQGKTQADRVGGRQLSLGNLGGGLVGLERLVGRVLATVANGELGEVTVVVTLPTEEDQRQR